MTPEFPIIEDYFVAHEAPPAAMDELWAQGWRHFGPFFFRYSISEDQMVQPLRVLLNGAPESQRHRRLRKRNADITVRVQTPRIDGERRELFERHSRRFTRNVPESLEDFLGPAPAEYPCDTVEIAAYAENRLVAASYLDVGREAVSSVYAIFDPAESKRGLGIATMLWEMDFGRALQRRLYYPGYAFHNPSSMDYKKQFPETEWYDWRTWSKLPAGPHPAAARRLAPPCSSG